MQTIYFGGGTPSLLSSEELQQIFNTIYKNYEVLKDAEITLEANPDDLMSVRAPACPPEPVRTGMTKSGRQSRTIFEQFKEIGINRLSIGVQSFFEEDLKLMNRAHNVKEALECITNTSKLFNNISIDLLYGIPGMSKKRWTENLNIALSLNIPHLSCYALTVEPKTALDIFIKKGSVPPVDDAAAAEHYNILLEMTDNAGYDNYEFSNFGKDGFNSQNNMAYWTGKQYLGIGPSAHSYDGNSRSWNVRNNTKYIKSIEMGTLPIEREILSETDKYNEYVMTGLRTKWGISLDRIEKDFGKKYKDYLLEQAKVHLDEGLLNMDNNILLVSKKGKFLSDGIAADLFLVNLD